MKDLEIQQTNFINKCNLIVRMIGIAIVVVSLAIIVSWFYKISFIIGISFNLNTIKFNTAVCFLLTGFVLLLLSSKREGFLKNISVITLSLMTMLVGGITIWEYASGIDYSVDQLFVKDITNLEGKFPGRMAFVTALGFIFSSFAFLLVHQNIDWLRRVFALVVFLIGLFSFCNILLNENINDTIAMYTTMALPTTLLFIALSIGMLLINPQAGIVELLMRNSSGGYHLRRMLPVIFLVPMFIVIIVNKLVSLNVITEHFGAPMIAAGTFVILTIILSSIVRKLDREENKLKDANVQIQQNEMIFRQYADNIDIVFYRTSPDLRKVLYASPAYEKVWGRSVESLYKNPMEWFDAILPEDQKKVHEEFTKGISKGNYSAFAEFRINRPDGTTRDILSRGFQLRDENNIPFCITGIAIDMSAVKQEQKYQLNRDDIVEVMEHEKSINVAGPKVLRMVCQMFDWDLGEIWLIDETKKILRFNNTWHKESRRISQYNKKGREHTFKLGEGLPGRIWQERGPVWIPNYSLRREFSRSFDAERSGLNCAFGMPVIFHDKIFGIMEFFSYKIQTPDEAMLNQMDQIGKMMGEFIGRMHTDDQIQSLSKCDMLTGLLNRSAFEEDLNVLIQTDKSEIIAVVLLDIDKFKIINEALGYDKGDLILQSVAVRLSTLMGEEKNQISRLGADKFVLYHYKIKQTEDIVEFVNKIDQGFREAFSIEQKEIYLMISIGVSIYPQDGDNSKKLIAHGDLALSHAKKQGGGKSLFYSKALPAIAFEKLAMHIDIRQAIAKKQFFMSFQPQVDLKTNRICGAEALIRWQHPIKGLISPADFIAYAEETGLIVSVNEYVMQMVFGLVQSNWKGPPISINISAQQFKNKYHLIDYIESLIVKFGVNPKNIEFEITESLFMDDTKHNISILTALHDLGFKFSIDDFGIGYSSFSYLYRVPAHKIKIDKSFITGLPGNHVNAEIVKSMIVMLHALGKVVVAEGVETGAEIAYLKNEKCDIIQGYYYYKPMPVEDFLTLLNRVGQSVID